MDRGYYLGCLDRGLELYWRTLAKARGLVLHTGEIAWMKSEQPGGPERIFRVNLAPDRAHERVAELVEMIRRGEAPSGVLLTHGSQPEDIDKILAAAGFAVDYDTGSVMAMDLGPSVDAQLKLNKHVAITTVADEGSLRVWTGVVNEALFEMELFSYEQFHDIHSLDNTYFSLGWLDGKPVSTCLTIVEDDVVAVEMVSTLREHRRRGAGTAVTVAALGDAQGVGAKTAVLRAEHEAVGVYRRIGFQEFYKRIVASFHPDR